MMVQSLFMALLFLGFYNGDLSACPKGDKAAAHSACQCGQQKGDGDTCPHAKEAGTKCSCQNNAEDSGDEKPLGCPYAQKNRG